MIAMAMNIIERMVNTIKMIMMKSLFLLVLRLSLSCSTRLQHFTTCCCTRKVPRWLSILLEGCRRWLPSCPGTMSSFLPLQLTVFRFWLMAIKRARQVSQNFKDKYCQFWDSVARLDEVQKDFRSIVAGFWAKCNQIWEQQGVQQLAEQGKCDKILRQQGYGK